MDIGLDKNEDFDTLNNDFNTKDKEFLSKKVDGVIENGFRQLNLGGNLKDYKIGNKILKLKNSDTRLYLNDLYLIYIAYQCKNLESLELGMISHKNSHFT